MARRPGGLDPAEVNRALRILSSVTSLEGLERAIAETPIMNSPLFHAILRQEYLRLHNEHSPYLENFAPKYQDFFMLLHEQAYQKLFEAVEPAKPSKQGEGPPVFAPPFFTQVADTLSGRLPEAAHWPLHPVRDRAQIEHDLRAVAGRDSSLPPYEPLTGSYWSALAVVCAACHHRWLALRAYAVDLVQALELVQPLREGRINNAACPHCGEIICLPTMVWIQDGPGAGDALASMSCIWRLSASAYSYQPPPGTRRVEDHDRILEVRCTTLRDRIPWLEPEDPGEEQAVALSLSVSYTTEELVAALARATETEAETPLGMETMIGEMSRKIRSGLLPLAEAETSIREVVAQVGADWPLVSPGYPLSRDTGDLVEYLVRCLIAEGVAAAHRRPSGIGAALAASTAQGLLMFGEVGLAEAALARAEDLLAEVAEGDPQQDLYSVAVANARAEVYDALERPLEAEEQRAQLRSSPAFRREGYPADALLSRFAQQQLTSSQALTYYETQQYAKALQAYPQCVLALERLVDEAASSREPVEQDLVPAIQHTLSGDLANWAAVLTDLAEHLETSQQFLALPALLRNLMQAGSGPNLATLYVQEAMPILNQMFPQGVSPTGLREQSLRLLQGALELSKAVKGWEFAGIQAHRIGSLLNQLGRTEEAKAALEEAIEYAARAGDHTRLWTAHSYLAEHAMKQGDGPKALSHLAEAAREWIREKVGLGIHATLGTEVLALQDAALQTPALGADPLDAIVVVESLKAATTAASLSGGMPLQPMHHEGQAISTELEELVQKREALRLQAIWNPNDNAITEELAQVRTAVEQERERLRVRDPRFGRWVDATDIALSDRQALLRGLDYFGPNTTLMGLVPFQDVVWTYVVWAGGSLITQRPLPVPNAQEAMTGVPDSDHRSLRPRQDTQTIAVGPWDQTYLAALAKATLDPLEERFAELEPDDRLIISASGGLHRVPFSVLPYHGTPLCEQVSICLVQGLGVLVAGLARPIRDVRSALCLGGPSHPGLTRLRGALAEAQEIAALFTRLDRESSLLVGPDATAPALRAHAAQSEVVHIACHALAPESAGGLSSLMLTPCPQPADNGILTDDRILNEILLSPGSLVNLAGCMTGAQTESSSPLLGGLIPAFLVAGASSVVASLWPIHDLKAPRFQTRFYEHLLGGSSPAMSLAMTQRECIDGALGEDMQDPSVWGGYVIYGVG